VGAAVPEEWEQQQHQGWFSSILTRVAHVAGDVSDIVGDAGALLSAVGFVPLGEALTGAAAALGVVSAGAYALDGNFKEAGIELGTTALTVFTGGLGRLGNFGRFFEGGETFEGLAGAFLDTAREAKPIMSLEDSSIMIRSAMSQRAWGYGGFGLVFGGTAGLQTQTWSPL
jgi:hypothetical protein